MEGSGGNPFKINESEMFIEQLVPPVSEGGKKFY